jgi:hypothetical protein
MDQAIRPHRPALRVPALVCLGAVLLLAACAKPAPTPPPPELTLEEAGAWWETTPAVTLSEYASLRMQMTFKNTSGVTLRFLGSANVDGPAGELQFWTTPGIAEPPATFAAFPEGDYAPDATFAWDVTIDLTGLPDAEKGFGLRPLESNLIGTVFPGQAEVVDATGTLAK